MWKPANHFSNWNHRSEVLIERYIFDTFFYLLVFKGLKSHTTFTINNWIIRQQLYLQPMLLLSMSTDDIWKYLVATNSSFSSSPRRNFRGGKLLLTQISWAIFVPKVKKENCNMWSSSNRRRSCINRMGEQLNLIFLWKAFFLRQALKSKEARLPRPNCYHLCIIQSMNILFFK